MLSWLLARVLNNPIINTLPGFRQGAYKRIYRAFIFLDSFCVTMNPEFELEVT